MSGIGRQEARDLLDALRSLCLVTQRDGLIDWVEYGKSTRLSDAARIPRG